MLTVFGNAFAPVCLSFFESPLNKKQQWVMAYMCAWLKTSFARTMRFMRRCKRKYDKKTNMWWNDGVFGASPKAQLTYIGAKYNMPTVVRRVDTEGSFCNRDSILHGDVIALTRCHSSCLLWRSHPPSQTQRSQFSCAQGFVDVGSSAMHMWMY